MMDENRFWEIIAASRAAAALSLQSPDSDFLSLQIEALREILRSLTSEEIVGYQWRFDDYRQLAYRWDLWGAAYWLGGGCSDDGFTDFRSCLISLGKERFFAVLNDPDSLVDLVDLPDVPYMQSEGFQYVASQIYREKTGQSDMPESGRAYLRKPVGTHGDFDDFDEMAERYPRLVERFPDMGD